MQVSTFSTYEPVLRSRVLQEPTVSPLPKVSATFTAPASSVTFVRVSHGTGLILRYTNPLHTFTRLPLDPFFYPLNADLNFVHLTTLAVVQKARMGEGRVVHRVLVGKPERRRPLGRPRLRWEDSKRWIFRKWEGLWGLDGVGSG
jgi:hypothetical protein